METLNNELKGDFNFPPPMISKKQNMKPLTSQENEVN